MYRVGDGGISVKRKLLPFAATIFLAFGFLGGCISINVDEARVFKPQPIANKANTGEEMHIEWEDVFERASNYTFTNDINNDRSTIKITKDDFVPVSLRHGFWADGAIAITEFTSKKVSSNAADRPLVVHCGGNSSDRYNSGTFFGLKVTPYANLIIFDYPGYGDSPGTPSAQSFETMIDNLASELNERRAKNDRPLILWGYSLGGFVCAELLGRVDKVDAIIIESSANNAQDAARQLVPAILRPFARVRLSPTLAAYDNVEALRTYQGNVLVLAGAKDGILPARFSRELVAGLEANATSVTYHEFPDGNHANLPTLDAYSAVLHSFFKMVKH